MLGWLMPPEGRSKTRLMDCHTRRCFPSVEGPRGARAWLRMKSPGWGMGRSAARNIPAPAQELEARRPIMASKWPLAGKGCPAELQTAVTMENLPSPPQQRPACSTPGLGAASPLPPAPGAKLSLSLFLPHTHSGLCRLGPGDGQLVPGRPNRPAAHLVWVTGGAGKEGSSGAQAARAKGALEPLTAESETRTREGGHCPRATQHRRG